MPEMLGFMVIFLGSNQQNTSKIASSSSVNSGVIRLTREKQKYQPKKLIDFYNQPSI